MSIRRFFQISVALAVLCVIPAAPAWAAHGGGGGGGGGMHGGGWRRNARQLGAAAFRQFRGYSGNCARQFRPLWQCQLVPWPAFAELPVVPPSQRRRELGVSRLGSLLPWGLLGARMECWGGDGVGAGDIRSGSRTGAAIHSAGADIGADYFCPYGQVYATGYPVAAYNYSYPDDGQYAANYAPRPAVAADNSPTCGRRRRGDGKRGSSVLQRSPGRIHAGAIIAMHCAWPATRAWNRRKMPRSTS